MIKANNTATATENKPVKLFSNTWRYKNHMLQRTFLYSERSKNRKGNVSVYRWSINNWEAQGNLDTTNVTHKLARWGMSIDCIDDAIQYIDALIKQTSYEPTDAAIEKFNEYCEMFAD